MSTPLYAEYASIPVSELPYYSYSDYLRNRYGRGAYRVAVDAGFSCPNRSGGRDGEGCTYCESSGARAVYLDREAPDMLTAQVERGIRFLTRRYGAGVFLLYFQAYTNTMGGISDLRQIYNRCLGLADFSELIVSTRPDEIDEEKADFLAEYKRPGFDVWVELGLQSVHDQTLLRVNRGHDSASFFRAFELLRSRGIKIAVHLIFGLPGEDEAEILESVRRVAALRPEGIKFHNLHIPVESPMFRDYLAGKITVPSPARHAEYVARAIPMLPPETVVLRMTCDTPKERRGAPLWVPPKGLFTAEVLRLMEADGMRQGSRFPAVY